MDIRQLFERHYPSLVWFLHGRLGDRDLAEDLAQEAFVRLIDKPPRAPDAWLYVVAGNLARDAQRGELRRARHLAIIDNAAAGAADPAPGADATICSAEESALVHETLALLPERDAALLVMHADDVSYREIAAAIGVSRTSVGPLLARAQQRFIRALGHRAHDRGVMREHPSEGTLQALLDGELPRPRAMVVRAHILRCAACRARAEATKETASLVNSLLRRSTPQVDSASAWARLVIRSDGRAESIARGPARWTSAAALALATAALIVTMVRGTPHAQPGADAFALVREAQAHPATELLRDACCSDHDGGDMNDDGLLTLSTIGEKVTVVIVYEDVDHSGTFTQGDIVRYVSTVPHSSSASQSAR